MSAQVRKNEIDMLHGPFLKKLLAVALPLAMISILQQFFNAADVAVMGRFASDNALAAVGANTPITTLFITFFTGLSTGANITLSTLIGKGEKERLNPAVNTIFTLSLICGLSVVVIGEILAKKLLVLISTPPEILDQAVLYLRIYLVAVMFSVIYNFNSAILRSKGDTRRPLICLMVSGVLNVLLNLLLVIVFKMDVAGVAIATLVANFLCAAATFVLLMRESDEFRVSIGKLQLVHEPLVGTLHLGVPAGIQAMLFSITNIIIQSGINSFGPDCIAGNVAAQNFEFIAYFNVLAFSQAAATFMSQNYGAGLYDRCRKIFRATLGLGVAFCAGFGMIFFFGGRFWIGLFSTSETVYQFAMVRMTCLVLLEFITAFNEMPAAGLRSMGYSLTPTVISIVGICVFRIIWIFTVFQIWHDIWVLMMLYPITWVLVGVVMTVFYLIKAKKRMQQQST